MTWLPVSRDWGLGSFRQAAQGAVANAEMKLLTAELEAG